MQKEAYPTNVAECSAEFLTVKMQCEDPTTTEGGNILEESVYSITIRLCAHSIGFFFHLID